MSTLNEWMSEWLVGAGWLPSRSLGQDDVIIVVVVITITNNIILVINITMNGGMSMNEWMNELRQMQVPIIGSRPRWLRKG